MTGGKIASDAGPVIPSDDYTNIDAHLTDGKRIVAYATPICKSCLKVIFNDLPKQEYLRKRLIGMLQKYDSGPKGFVSEDLAISGLYDLTNELLENGVISCQ